MNDSTITRLTYGDRTMLSHVDDVTGEESQGWADLAHEAVRGLNHITNGPHPLPAPDAYRVLGNLAGLAHMLPQLCDQIGNALAASLNDPEIEVYDHKREPAESVALATKNLRKAAELARALGAELDAAQVAINSQGYEHTGRP